MLERIKNLLQTKPFSPFTVVMSSGERYEVRHPEHALLTKHLLIIADADNDAVIHDLYLLHISELKRGTPTSV